MFSILFIAFLLADILVRLWLANRQIKHIYQHRDQVPELFVDRVSLRSHQRAADYTVGGVRLQIAERITDAIILVGFTLLGGLQWLDSQLALLIQHEMLRQLALVASVFILLGIAGLPFSLWRTFVLNERFGFNRVTPGLFVADSIKSLIIVLILGGPLVATILWLMGNTGIHWVWLAWLTWIGFKFLVIWLFPTVLAPLFNRFTPLDAPELQERIYALAKRCEFPLTGLYVMDGSKRSAHGNAYFTGVGRNKRIVFFDTLLSRLNTDEVEAVLAHELGHFKHKHIARRTVVGSIMALALLAALHWCSQQVWFFTGLGVIPQLGRPNDAMALILFFMVMPVFTFWLTPWLSYRSRRDEFDADRFAVQQSSGPALASALVKLYHDNAATLTPDPLHSAFYDSHPPALTRIQALHNASP